MIINYIECNLINTSRKNTLSHNLGTPKHSEISSQNYF